MKKNPTERRYLTILLIIAAVFIALAFRLVQLQIVNGAAYLQTSITRTTATLPIKAPRGEIFDRYGRPIVTNRMGFSVVMQREKMTNTELNAQIFAMIEVVGKSGDSYIDTLAISKTTPFEFTGSDDEIAALQKMYKKEGMSADELLEHIINRYDIAASDKEQERLIAGVRYEMANRAFGNSNPFTFAQDVSKETVAIFEEQNQYYRGVRIIDEPIREYINPNLAAHIIGRVGIIYAEEYAEKRNLGYSMTDMVGKDGIEKYLEASLKGNDGVSAISEVLVPAQMGSFGVLTLDSHLQKTLEDSLRNNIIGMRSKKDAGGANAGGAVVLDVNTGEILAMASYPSFNLETFNQDYKALSTSANKPLFNRAIGGAYAPGSTLKMLTALAGLEENAITPRETIQDKGKFTKYNDYQPACWLWNQSSASHGYINVVEALKVSCNYFFYELGERLGIEKLNKYGRALGLGQATGIEIGGESSGIMAGPEYRKRQGTIWVPGDTLQSAIGQGDNLLTPLQLASYIATIASGGTRYKPHLVKSIKSYDVNKSGGEVAPVVLDSIDMKKENYDTIMQGMRDVSEAGTASSVFANYKVAVGSKTGTATISKSEVNAVFVAVAPLDKPEIAIAVVVEKGGHGSYAAPIAKDVLDAYFDTSSVVAPMNKIGSLLQ